MSEEEKLGKRLNIMMFIMFLIFLAAVLITCVFYSPKTFTPKISESEPEEKFVSQSEISEEDDSVFPIKINTATLISLGKKELQEIVEAGETIHIECQFCDTIYDFTPDEIAKILQEI